MELEGRKVIILIEELYNELEFWYPYYRMKEAGADVVVVGAGALQYHGKSGIAAKADVNAKDVSTNEFDGIIIPGGYAPDMMRRHPDMIRLVRECSEAGKAVAAICHAGWLLASAEIISSRRVTSFFAIKDDMVHAGADWVDEEVVVDGNLITSRKPDDLPAFTKAIIRAMS